MLPFSVVTCCTLPQKQHHTWILPFFNLIYDLKWFRSTNCNSVSCYIVYVVARQATIFALLSDTTFSTDRLTFHIPNPLPDICEWDVFKFWQLSLSLSLCSQIFHTTCTSLWILNSFKDLLLLGFSFSWMTYRHLF